LSEQRLVLIRHAQGSLGTDDYDRLSVIGHRQARRIGHGVPVGAHVAHGVRGRLRRHRETAAYLDPGGGWHVDADLDEYRVDRLLATALAQAHALGLQPPPQRAWDDPAGYLEFFLKLFPRVLDAWQRGRIECDANGRWSAFQGRVEAAARRLSAAVAEHGCVVAVTSAGVISTMAASLLERDLRWQRRLNVSLYNAAVTELVRGRDGRWDAVRINCVAHLEADQKTLA